MSNSVYFSQFRINKDTQNVSLLVTSSPFKQATGPIEGFQVGVRTQQKAVKFGCIALTDPETGNSMKASHPTAVALRALLVVGREIPGFRFDEPMLDRETGEPLKNLFWVEPA